MIQTFVAINIIDHHSFNYLYLPNIIVLLDTVNINSFTPVSLLRGTVTITTAYRDTKA